MNLKPIFIDIISFIFAFIARMQSLSCLFCCFCCDCCCGHCSRCYFCCYFVVTVVSAIFAAIFLIFGCFFFFCFFLPSNALKCNRTREIKLKYITNIIHVLKKTRRRIKHEYYRTNIQMLTGAIDKMWL